MGFKHPGSAGNAWAAIKKKINAAAAAQGDEDAMPMKPTPKKNGANGGAQRSKKTPGEETPGKDGSDGEQQSKQSSARKRSAATMENDGTPSKRGKKAKEESVDSAVEGES